jgi:hypothetical protein
MFNVYNGANAFNNGAFLFCVERIMEKLFFYCVCVKNIFRVSELEMQKKIMIEFTAILCFLSEKKKLYDE